MAKVTHGSAPFEVKHPDGRTTSFTKEQWEMLGPTKDGWVKVKNEPDEVKELRQKEQLTIRKNQINSLELDGILTDDEINGITAEQWPVASLILSKVQERIPAIVSYKVQQLTGVGAKAPAEPTKVEEPAPVIPTPAIGEDIHAVAKVAVENEPPVKIIVDTTPLPRAERPTDLSADNTVAPANDLPTTVGQPAADEAAEKAVKASKKTAKPANEADAAQNA